MLLCKNCGQGEALPKGSLCAGCSTVLMLAQILLCVDCGRRRALPGEAWCAVCKVAARADGD